MFDLEPKLYVYVDVEVEWGDSYLNTCNTKSVPRRLSGTEVC